jgi:hypothetical protein
MTSKSFLIGLIGDGLRKDLKAWGTPEDSFQTLLNLTQFRGRITKRAGYTTLGRLSPDGITFPGNPVMGLRTQELFGIGLQNLIGFDTTTSYLWNGTNFITLPSYMPVTWSGTDYEFFWTTNYAGAFWATNSNPGLNGFDISAITAGITTSVETKLTNNFQVGDTTTFINVGGMTQINGLTGVVTTSGNPFIVNINSSTFSPYTTGGIALDSIRTVTGQDGIRYYATTVLGNTWVNYNPPVDPNNALAGALMIFAYRGYLVFLNTWEGNDAGIFNYGNRARWTQIGTPYYSAPVPNTPSLQTIDPLTMRDDLFGRGGANDAPTSEVIVAAGFIRDILVVEFERSTWRLRFVNNAQNPFVWERVNIELGSYSTFSTILFDKGLMSIGIRGIIISDGNDTKRFDEKIPDDVFEIRNANHGVQRVYGIRTFDTKFCYWTYPSDSNPNGIFPDYVLVYNYDTSNWSYFDDCFTCFGYNYPQGVGLTWANLINPWNTYNDLAWNSGIIQGGVETIIAGNQQGFVLSLEQDSGINSPSLYISAISGVTMTSPNNNLPDGSWITISGVTGSTLLDGTSLNGRNLKIANPGLDPNIFTITEFKPIGAGNASGTSFNYTIDYLPIIPGSVQINVGILQFTDDTLDGTLLVAGVPSGNINYLTGLVNLTFNSSISSTPVNIRVVSLSDQQEIVPTETIGAYTGEGLIAKISNFNATTKIFNFFKDDKRSRLSKIDFYVDRTDDGQFTCNILTDSSSVPVNTPLPENLQSNVVLTSANPYQFAEGEESIYRLYCDAISQTVQLELTLQDWQMAVNAINSEDFVLNAMMITLKRGGRLV